VGSSVVETNAFHPVYALYISRRKKKNESKSLFKGACCEQSLVCKASTLFTIFSTNPITDRVMHWISISGAHQLMVGRYSINPLQRKLLLLYDE
jgi:hypothetical protein